MLKTPRQKGAALVIGLILLMILTLLAFTVLSALAGRWLLGTLSGQRDSQPLQAALERLNNAEIRHERAYAELTQSAETT